MDNLEKLKNEGIYKEGDAILYGNSLPALWEIAVMLIALIAAIIEGEYFIVLCGSFFFAWLIYAFAKAKKKK